MSSHKRYSIYTFFMHGLIICSMLYFGALNKASDEKEKEEASRVIEVDIFKPAKDSIMAETITDEDYIKEILGQEDLTQTYTTEEKVKLEEQRELERAKVAKKYQKEKSDREKEKQRIKKENEELQKKINSDKRKIVAEKLKNDLAMKKIEKDKQDKKKKELDAKNKKKEAERLKEKVRMDKIKLAKDEREMKLQKERDVLLEKMKKRKLEDEKRNKLLAEQNKIKNMSKEDWLETSEGKKDYTMYSTSLYKNVYGMWVKPFHAKSGWNCSLDIIQDKNGVVKNIKNIKCNPNNKDLIDSVQRAVSKASPLPLPKDPRLFDNKVKFTFSIE